MIHMNLYLYRFIDLEKKFVLQHGASINRIIKYVDIVDVYVSWKKVAV